MPVQSFSMLTDAVKASLLESLRGGNYRVVACAKAGIHRDTLSGWEQRAKAGEEPYASFIAELHQAEAESEARLLAEIRQAAPAVTGVSGPDLWQAKAWILERRFPKRWGLRVRAAVNEELEGLLDRLQKRLDADVFEKVIDAAREETPGEEASARAARH